MDRDAVAAGVGCDCYRALLGAADLLGTATSPTFTTQVPAGSPDPFSFDVFGDWGQTDSTGATRQRTC